MFDNTIVKIRGSKWGSSLNFINSIDNYGLLLVLSMMFCSHININK
jgi:hypothetical protein